MNLKMIVLGNKNQRKYTRSTMMSQEPKTKEMNRQWNNI